VTALAIIAAGAGIGAGLSAILHGVLRGPNGFRVLFALALVPAALVAVLVRRLPETHGEATGAAAVARLGAIPIDLRERLAMIMGIVAAVNAMTGPANFYAFIYAENLLHIKPSIVSTVVALSAITGLLGLLIGRRLADGQGRRRAVAIGVLASAATSLYAYSGGAPAFISGYMIGVCAAAMLAPALAALATESFPGDVRASAGGWIVVAGVLGGIAGLAVFGVVADATGSLAWASVCAFLPGLPTLLFLRSLPETKGLALT
jgi:MFS family permease